LFNKSIIYDLLQKKYKHGIGKQLTHHLIDFKLL
jgi:hypothetical protein